MRGLYGDELPPLVYLYRVSRPSPEGVLDALTRDPLLRALTTGRFEPLRSPAEQRQAVLAFGGTVPSTCPVLLRGSSWTAFDLTPIMPQLRSAFDRYPIPHVKDMPPPR